MATRPEPRLKGAPDFGPEGRYVTLSLLGRGGMGEVYRVRDRVLGRDVALKVVRGDRNDSDQHAARFAEEAQIAAQLEHPGIVPVYDHGALPDGRLYFTMREVQGHTFSEPIISVHADAMGGQFRVTPDGWTFLRLVQVLTRICEAVAYAHARGVLHRDLKPQNVMLGAFGEVLVMDWGLAKPVGAKSSAEVSSDETPVRAEHITLSLSPNSPSIETSYGTQVGTMQYMSPEQARGQLDRMGPPSDVYALGAMLFEVLTGQVPLQPSSLGFMVPRPAPSPRLAVSANHPPLPDELVAVCERALAFEPGDRYAHAGEMAVALAAWLDGAQRRAQAEVAVSRARALLVELTALRSRAAERALDARQVEQSNARLASDQDRSLVWSIDDEVQTLRREIRLSEVELLQGLHSALGWVPDLLEAKQLLAAFHRERYEVAVLEHDALGATEHRRLLEVYDTGEHAEFLRDEARLSLKTVPSGARVELSRCALVNRRWQASFEHELGPTPLDGIVLKAGRCVLEISAPGFETIRVPTFLEAQAHSDFGATVLQLPLRGTLSPDECYVAAGPFVAGGDEVALDALPRQWVHVDAFIARRYPVTHGEYLAFLNALLATKGPEAAVLAFTHAGARGVDARLPTFTLAASSVELLPARHRALEYAARQPVVEINWHQASAYAAFVADQDDLPWRLPHELEWEKAARGVDGRIYAWGDHFEVNWASLSGSRDGPPELDVIGAFPTDESPYGLRDVVGGVREWCANRWRIDGGVCDGTLDRIGRLDLKNDEAPRSARGGSWKSTPSMARLAARFGSRPEDSHQGVGFRLVRSG